MFKSAEITALFLLEYKKVEKAFLIRYNISIEYFMPRSGL